MDRAGVVWASMAFCDHLQNVDLIDELVVLEGEAGHSVTILLNRGVVEIDEVVILKVRIQSDAQYPTLTATTILVDLLDRPVFVVCGKLMNGDSRSHGGIIEFYRAGALDDEDALLVINGDLHRIIE